MLFENHPVRFGIVQGGFVFWLRHAGLGRPYRARYVGGRGFPGRCPGLTWFAPLGRGVIGLVNRCYLFFWCSREVIPPKGHPIPTWVVLYLE